MSKRPIYYDTETTGVKSENDRIIEIAAYDPVLDKTFEQLIHPAMPIPKESTAVHHITDEMVKDQPTFKDVGPAFAEFCSGDVVLIAHNNDNFDKHFLTAEFKRNDLEIPDWDYLDTLKWARKYRPDLPRHSLQVLRETFGIEANNAHRALDDVMILYQVFSILLDDIPIETALELMKQARNVSHMPFGKYQGTPIAKVPKDYIRWLSKSGAFDKKENSDLKESFEKAGAL